MKEMIEKNVKASIRSCLDSDGLLDTIKLSYNDLDYDLADIIIPTLNDPKNEDEFDRVHAFAEDTARSVFNEIRRQLRIAHATIQVALS